MANRPKTPMPISERAKQFLPFAAVKGLPEALAKKEKVTESKVELSEEMAMALNEKMNDVQMGSTISITYFYRDAYVQLTGSVVQIDPIFRTIQIDDTTIEIDDILDFEVDRH